VSSRDAPADAQAILANAAERGKRMGLRYAGAVTPVEAKELADAGAAMIVDVRTEPEYVQVGHIAGTPRIEWPRNGGPPEMEAFVEELRHKYQPGEKLLFLCRSGVRSHYAADLAARAGFESAYNILEGFEGENGAGLNGWRATGLPWKQGKD
jgi:rhodanese-related sulfurtransferase